MRMEIKFGGYGGQGIILMGNITARAAVLYDNKNAIFTPSYGCLLYTSDAADE